MTNSGHGVFVARESYATFIHSCADLEELTEAAAEGLIEILRGAVSANGQASLALSGGQTPLRLYRLLGDRYRNRLPWENIHLFWSDERYVPPSDPASNFGAAYRALVARLPIPPANVHAVRTDLENSDQSVSDYETRLCEHFDVIEKSIAPSFDLVLLGLGTDGHTASLFPGDPALHGTDGWVRSTTAPAGSETAQRITFTLNTINAANVVFFLVSGPTKAPIVRAVMNSPRAADIYPSAMVSPKSELHWFLDEPAAGTCCQ